MSIDAEPVATAARDTLWPIVRDRGSSDSYHGMVRSTTDPCGHIVAGMSRILVLHF